MSIIEKATAWAENIANDNSHGYSQATRWGPDYDCSSLVYSAYKHAGLPLPTGGAQTTWSLYADFTRVGFKDVTSSCDLSNGNGMKRGDVLLETDTHTVIYAGNGKVINARSSEGNVFLGDQSGNEIRIQPYWPFAKYVLRYAGDEVIDDCEEIRVEPYRTMIGEFPLLTEKLADTYTEATAGLQCLLQLRQIGDSVEINGLYDTPTFNAVLFAQKIYGLVEDGEAGAETIYALLTDGGFLHE